MRIDRLTFKTERIREEWIHGQVPSALVALVGDYVSLALPFAPRSGVVMTSLWRSWEEELAIEKATGKPTSKIHFYWRAADFSIFGITESAVKVLTARMNHRWIYDAAAPDRKVVAFSERHGTGPHMHLQVHPTTYRREK